MTLANLQIFLGSAGILGFILMFFWVGKWFGKIDERFNRIDEKFKSIDENFKTMDEKSEGRFKIMGDRIDDKFRQLEDKINDISRNISSIKSALVILETRVEERTLKVVYTQRQFEDKVFQN